MRQDRALHEMRERRRLLRRCSDVRRGVGAVARGQGGRGDHGDDQRRGNQVEGGTPWRDHMILPLIGSGTVVQHGEECAGSSRNCEGALRQHRVRASVRMHSGNQLHTSWMLAEVARYVAGEERAGGDQEEP